MSKQNKSGIKIYKKRLQSILANRLGSHKEAKAVIQRTTNIRLFYLDGVPINKAADTIL